MRLVEKHHNFVHIQPLVATAVKLVVTVTCHASFDSKCFQGAWLSMQMIYVTSSLLHNHRSKRPQKSIHKALKLLQLPC